VQIWGGETKKSRDRACTVKREQKMNVSCAGEDILKQEAMQGEKKRKAREES